MIKVDTDTGSVAMAIDGGAGVAFTDDGVWVALPGQAEFQKLDPVSGDTLASISEATPTWPPDRIDLAVAIDGVSFESIPKPESSSPRYQSRRRS